MSKQARLKTREMRKERELQAKRTKSRKRLLTTLGSLVIVGLLVAIAVVVVRAVNSGDDEPKATGDLVVPANVVDDAIPVGKKTAPTTVDLYYDYMCPACGAFESVNGDDLDKLITSGDILLNLHPLSFLDEQSNGTRYSTRTAEAIAAVANGAPDKVWAFHSALYASQPKEQSDGLTDDQIAKIAATAGVPQDVIDTFTDGTFARWVVQSTAAGFKAGITQTPTIKINGEQFTGEWGNPGELAAAIAAAKTSK